MQATIRRKLDAGRRALDFGRDHPTADPAHGAALVRLADLLARAAQAASRQDAGFARERSANARKFELRRSMAQLHLRHLAGVAGLASAELPSLERKLALVRDARSYESFRLCAGDVAAEAVARRELLARHGLVEMLLDDLEHSLDKFDTAVVEGDRGRRTHIGATADLMNLADDVMAAVATLDTVNRVRFAADAATLAAWERARSVAASAGGEVKPAA